MWQRRRWGTKMGPSIGLFLQITPHPALSYPLPWLADLERSHHSFCLVFWLWCEIRRHQETGVGLPACVELEVPIVLCGSLCSTPTLAAVAPQAFSSVLPHSELAVLKTSCCQQPFCCSLLVPSSFPHLYRKYFHAFFTIKLLEWAADACWVLQGV